MKSRCNFNFWDFMIISALYIVLAVLGLSFLIFIHELGHYFVARRVGMRVETFAIGFGQPIYSWMHDGVKWQLGWIPFGGYVRIAGQDGDETKDPYSVPDGFFGKSPWDRIKVALAGPIANLLLAFLLFATLWVTGGREKNYAEFTKKIGWVDPRSSLYAAGIRPGDEISAYAGVPYESSKDNLYGPMTHPGRLEITGNKVDYLSGARTPYAISVDTYPHPAALQKGILTAGILAPANYIIYDRLPNGQESPLPEGSPMKASGIQYGDKIVWVDGDLIFSGMQLSTILNDGRVMLTVVRNGEKMLVRVPRVPVEELKMDNEFREELTDWQYEAHLNNVKLQKLFVIPYHLNNEGVVQSQSKFIDKDIEKEIFPTQLYASNEAPLQVGDKILAIDGAPIKTSYELLADLQKRSVNIIVAREPEAEHPISYETADAAFDHDIDLANIEKIVDSIGTDTPVVKAGKYVLLHPVTPTNRSSFELSPEKQEKYNAEMQEQKKAIEAIDDTEKRTQAMALFQKQEKQLILGLTGVQDVRVKYNPTPIKMFDNVFAEIWRTLVALVSGALNPKWMSGPLGIVQVVHDNWMVGIKEAIFWLGAISLNLGVLNLLPIPVLDGGTIMLSVLEWVTGKKMKPKTMEKLVFPFVILLIAFFVFLTYQDLTRIFSKFMGW